MLTLVFTVAVYTGAIHLAHRPRTPRGGGGCVYKGSVHPVGKLQTENPCAPCFCSDDGTVSCPPVAYDCIIACVDPVNKKDECCPFCPNGHNCRGPNGSVIAAGHLVVLPSGETCKCPPVEYNFHTPPPPAVCSPSEG